MRTTPNQAVTQLLNLEKTSDRPIFIMAVGLPCSGKSTILDNVARQLAARGSSLIVTGTDLVFDRLAAERGITYNEAFKQISFKEVGRIFKKELSEALRALKNVAVDQTNMSKKSRASKMLDVKDHYKICLNVDAPMPVILERNKIRAQNGKFIPVGVIMNMAGNYNPVTKAEGFDTIIEVVQ